MDKKVLIVDDEPDLREILTFDFKRQGYKVSTAENGLEAAKVLAQEIPDVVVSDLRMPKGDGIFLLNEIEKRFGGSAPVVILMSGFSDLTVEDAFHRGVHAFFSKPFDRKALLQAAAEALRAPQERWLGQTESKQVTQDIPAVFSNFEKARDEGHVNVGNGGLFLAKTGALPAVGEAVRFKLEFEDRPWSPIHGWGLVRWVRAAASEPLRQGLGIEFRGLAEASFNFVIDILSRNKTRAFIPKG